MNMSVNKLSKPVLLLSLLFAILAAVAARAQSFRGSILGAVTDPSGAVLAGAKVTVQNVDTGVARATQTNDAGEYNVPELPIGTYTVTIEASGFETSVTTGIKVDVAAAKRVDATLKTGAISQQVTVSAEVLPQVETTSDTLGATLTSNTVKDIPVNGRDYTKLIYLTPGVAGSPDQISDSPGSFGEFSMNGARGRSNNYLLDGTDMNDGYRNDPAINEAGVFGTPATILPIDAVSELRVLSNYEPEYGRNAGAVVNIVTKSGTNDLHGSAIEYFRNNALDARNFFNSTGPQAPFHNNQFGGSLGGPIVKDKTFFFGDYEGQRETVGVVSLANVPVPSQLVATNPVIQGLLAHFPNNDPWPAPNLGGNTASVIAPSFNSVDSFIAKVDHNFNSNNLVTGRYYLGDSGQAFPLALTGGGVLPGFDTTTPTRVQLVSISWASVRSSTKVNEFRFGWNRFAEGFFPQDKSFAPSSVGLCAAATTAGCTGAAASNQGLPVINVDGFAQLGASKSDPRDRVDTNWQAFDNFSWQVGKHDVKLGYEFRRTSIRQFLGTNFRGVLKFSSLADFLSGTVDGGSAALGNSNRNTYENNHGLYIQDSYRFSPRLTLNYGLRWDYFGVVKEKNNLFSNVTNFDATGATVTLTQVGQSGLGSLYNPDYNNFAPRVSFAWDPLGGGKTVVRGGFGVFYDAFSQDFFLGHLPFNCSFCPGPAYNPFGPAPIFSVGTVGGAIATGVPVFTAPGATPSGSIFAVDRNIRTPYLENYNLNIQRQLSSRVVLQVGYVGSAGHKLFAFRDLNQPGQAAITASDIAFAQANSFTFQGTTYPCFPLGGPGCINSGVFNAGVPRVFGNNPYGAFYINQEESNGNSNYNSLQASLRVNGWHGVTSIVNYVWSHSLDTSSDGEDFVPNAAQPNNSTQPGLDYGNSNFDIRNRFTWIFGYELPKMGGSYQRLKNGWGVDSTLTLQDGQPFQLNYNFEGDFSGSGEGFDRPDVIGPVQYTTNPAQFLNLTSFATPCTALAAGSVQLAAFQASGLPPDENCVPGTRHFGSLGRNTLRGPSFKQWDFALYKNTPLTERLTMQFRAEFFNILNHPNFSNPLLPAFISDAAQQGIGSNGASLGSYQIQATGDVGIGNPFLGGGGPRGIQLAVKFDF
ncbi:MAG TPA: carboxypeptidase regulatory-like domain-containing protein [Terriglobia bacterium]|nr:carboxypeptidase regulatory-like domain-containing protein [Terriglobia bacterium]